MRAVDHPCRTDERLEWQRLGARGTLDEMDRSVDVGAGMRSHVQPRDVARSPAGDRLCEVDPDRWIAGEDRHPWADRDGHVDPASAPRIRVGVHRVRVAVRESRRAPYGWTRRGR